MKTSKEWWDTLLADNDKMVDWLKRQYHGELMAGGRIREVFKVFELSQEDAKKVAKVAREEDLHASLIATLLEERGVPAEVLEHEERYWKHAYDKMDTVEDAAAVGFLAEEMRLERISVIANCVRSPFDIKKVMGRIYTQEVGHVQTFKDLTNADAIEAHMEKHNEGLNALGLVA
jgi:tRNA isopentenyl-2-thiomethyl-A-37 hydroxylase MiaE